MLFWTRSAVCIGLVAAAAGGAALGPDVGAAARSAAAAVEACALAPGCAGRAAALAVASAATEGTGADRGGARYGAGTRMIPHDAHR